MSRFNPSGSAASSALWNEPISQQQQQQEQQQQYDAQDEYAQQQEPVDYDIYNKAVAISSPRLGGITGALGEPAVDPQSTIRKTVIRRVEVPFTRTVQVPTQVVKLVPTTVEQKVAVKRLVESPGYQTVNESYVEYEDREAIREKEVWVKKIVPERYVERVAVQKVRQIQKPTTVVKEIESWEVVQVPTTRRVVVPGFRVEEVADSRLVEVEEEQTFALRPEPIGPNEIKSTTDLGRLQNPNSHLPDAPYGSQPQGTPVGRGFGSPQFGSSQGYNRPSPPAAAASSSPFGGSAANPLDALRSYGLGVDETHTRHTEGTGVVVTRIERGGVAARAGLQVGDIITAVQGRPTSTVAEFVQLLQRALGAVTLNVNRDGRRNIALVFGK